MKRFLGRSVKIGHGGTLDSSATGALVLMMGAATRLSSLIMSMPKQYTATIQLGAETSTCDATGDLVSSGDISSIRESDIDRTLFSYIGWHDQIPPEISAVHVSGRRAHEISRSGETPEITPRPTFVQSIERTTTISSDGRFDIVVNCGRGTYIRSLARDIGRDLGCFAHIASLRRDCVGIFSLDSSSCVKNFSEIDPNIISGSIMPCDRLIDGFPSYRADPPTALRLTRGMCVGLDTLERISLGKCRHDGDLVMIFSDTAVTVARIDTGSGRPVARPETNIALS